MDALDHFRRMAGNNRWSNDRLHRAVSALDEAGFHARRSGFFPSIALTLNHVLEVDLLYLDFLEENGQGLGAIAGFEAIATAAALSAAQAAADARLCAFCDRIGSADLDRSVETDRGDEGAVPERIGDLLGHLFLHQIHHRGQVHAMLSGTDQPPPQLDEYLLDFDRDRRSAEMRRLGLTERERPQSNSSRSA